MGTTETKQLVADASARWEKGEGSVFGVIAEGDTAVVHWKGHALALDGVPYDNEYCWIMRVAGDRVAEVVAWFDAGPLNELINRVQPAQ